MKRLVLAVLLVLSALAAGVAPARAAWSPPFNTSLATMTFDGVTNNKPADTAIGEDQLLVSVEAVSLSQLRFLFTNTGDDAAVISEIYFDDLAGRVSSIAGFDSIVGNVSFKVGGAPPNLPGGNELSPVFISDFMADTNNPPPARGVGPGEQIGVLLNLKQGKLVEDVLGDLQLGSLRVGLHVIAFNGGGSESFVNNPPKIIVPPPVPEPGALGLLGFGLIALGLRWKGRNRA